jgi:prepilin-type N-terminal cleavage/methylation domain-containing protein
MLAAMASSRPGFSAIELVLVIALIAVVAGVSVPMYRRYQTRSDLQLATEQVVQGINRARLLSQAGQGDSAWGFAVGSGVLFKGSMWAVRDPAYDELYPMPNGVVTAGIPQVSFSKIEGRPSATGMIIMTALTGEHLTVEIEITSEGIPLNTSDRITVCHMQGNGCFTKALNENAWPAHQGHGDYIGPCRDSDGDGNLCDHD